jgi:hypothetical protein
VSEQREQSTLNSLARLPKKNLVLVGGYAVNAYVPPRFSVDCDIVVLHDIAQIEKELKQQGFEKGDAGDVPFGHFVHYESKPTGVSFDLFIHSLVDNRSGVVFQGELFDKYSSERRIVGRMAIGMVTMRVADPELLFATKFAPARKQDARDIFMLSGTKLDCPLVERLIRERCPDALVKTNVTKFQAIIGVRGFRNSINGAYGRIPDETYDRCKKGLGSFFSRLVSHRKPTSTLKKKRKVHRASTLGSRTGVTTSID